MSFNIRKMLSKISSVFASSVLCRALPRCLTLRLAAMHCYAVMQQSSFALLFLVGLNIFLPLVSNMVFLDQFMLFVVLLPGMLAIVYAQALQYAHHIREIPHLFQLPISHAGRFVACQFSLLFYWLLAIAAIGLSVLFGSVADQIFTESAEEIFGHGVVHAIYADAGTWVFLQQLLALLLVAHILVNFACVIGAVSRRYAVFKGFAVLVLIVFGLVLLVRHMDFHGDIAILSWENGSGPHPWEWALLVLTDLVLLVLQFFALKRIKIY